MRRRGLASLGRHGVRTTRKLGHGISTSGFRMHAIEWESVFGRAAPKIPTRRTPPVRRDPESVADRVLASTETGDIKSLEQGLADIRGGIDKLDPLLALT